MVLLLPLRVRIFVATKRTVQVININQNIWLLEKGFRPFSFFSFTDMKRLFFLLLITASSQAFAQNCANDFLGTKALYKKPATILHTAPAGYEPVFINHIGRHGARHLTKDVN